MYRVFKMFSAAAVVLMLVSCGEAPSTPSPSAKDNANDSISGDNREGDSNEAPEVDPELAGYRAEIEWYGEVMTGLMRKSSSDDEPFRSLDHAATTLAPPVAFYLADYEIGDEQATATFVPLYREITVAYELVLSRDGEFQVNNVPIPEPFGEVSMPAPGIPGAELAQGMKAADEICLGLTLHHAQYGSIPDLADSLARSQRKKDPGQSYQLPTKLEHNVDLQTEDGKAVKGYRFWLKSRRDELPDIGYAFVLEPPGSWLLLEGGVRLTPQQSRLLIARANRMADERSIEQLRRSSLERHVQAFGNPFVYPDLLKGGDLKASGLEPWQLGNAWYSLGDKIASSDDGTKRLDIFHRGSGDLAAVAIFDRNFHIDWVN